MDEITLQWHGHACFSLTYQGYTLVLDPYEDHYVRGLVPLDLSADLVLCSHGHGDHSAADIVATMTGHENPFRITEISTFHDPECGRLRGKNTIHLLEAGHFRMAHFGDIGCELTPDQAKLLSGLDVAMIPVGGFYTIGPEEAKALVDAIGPKIVIPMHYRMGELGLPNVEEVDGFLSLMKNFVRYSDNTITITKSMPAQVAVLQYCP